MNRTIAAPLRPGALRPPARRRARAHPRALCSRWPCSCALLTDDEVGLRGGRSASASPSALPLVALLAATAVLGPEIDDGSVVYLLAKPVSRHVIAVSKYAAAWAATMVLGALPLARRGAGPRRRREPAPGARAGASAAAVAGTAYTALFLGLAALTRHAVVVGLLFALLWEGVLGTSSPASAGWRSARGAARSPARSARASTGAAPVSSYAVVAAAARHRRRRCGSPATGCGRSPCAATSRRASGHLDDDLAEGAALADVGQRLRHLLEPVRPVDADPHLARDAPLRERLEPLRSRLARRGPPAADRSAARRRPRP